MTDKEFLDTFKKVYGGEEENIHGFFLPQGVEFLGGVTGEYLKKAIGVGLSPGTYAGIRICEDNIFKLRKIDSEILYSCHKDNLGEYRDDEWAEEIFKQIDKLLGVINVKGAEILVAIECGEMGYDDIKAAVCYGFIKLFLGGADHREITKIIAMDERKYNNFSRKLIGISAKENHLGVTFENNVVSVPVELNGCRAVVAIIDKKGVKVDFEKDIKRIMSDKNNPPFEDIKMYQHLPEYKYLAYFEKEKERILLSESYIMSGNITELAKLINKSAEEYLKLGKNSALNDLFYIMSSMALFSCVYNDRGVVSIISDIETDEYIEKVDKIFNKKTGSSPEFYISDISSAKMF